MTDPTPISDEELSAMQARCDAATEGPWRWERNENDAVVDFSQPEPRTIEGYEFKVLRDASLRSPVNRPNNLPTFIVNTWDESLRSDADFIAHSRTDLPRLIAEVIRLRAVEKELREALTFYADEGNYSDGNIHAGSQSILLDNGERARAALAREMEATAPAMVADATTHPDAPPQSPDDWRVEQAQGPAPVPARDTPTTPDHFAGAGNMVPARDTLHQQVMNIPVERAGYEQQECEGVTRAYSAREMEGAYLLGFNTAKAAAAELVQQQQGGWISIAEAMPPTDDDVLVNPAPNGGVTFAVTVAKWNGEVWHHDNWNRDADREYFTHWMKLPPAPGK